MDSEEDAAPTSAGDVTGLISRLHAPGRQYPSSSRPPHIHAVVGLNEGKQALHVMSVWGYSGADGKARQDGSE